MTEVDISDLPKAAVLAALYNAALPPRLHFLFPDAPEVMDVQHADWLIYGGRTTHLEFYFTTLYGRQLQVGIGGATFNPRAYDSENGGDGTAQRVIDELRASLS